MFPIGDDPVRGGRPGLVNYLFIALNVLVFIFQATMDPNTAQAFVNQWGVIPVEILQGNRLETLLTSMFMHGGWLHLIGNMVFLWVFGDNIEAALGHLGYLVFYLLGGLAASAAHIMLNPDSTVPSVGASGAISAVLGAYIVMFPRSQVRALVIWGLGGYITRVSALIFLGIWFLTQLLSGIASIGVQTAQTGGVAFWAHIGGFVFGLVAGFLMKGRAANLRFDRRQA
jgi:membrane associated rhomboid family serine protease